MAKSDQVPWLNGDEQVTWFSLIGTLMRLPAASTRSCAVTPA